ncbi:unnamed protein product [Calicophoron daubneyi]|uniref:14-3-3 domain-containing protein n=1 Tax=Calicophoron daubneyi TaxID=300641 RepID=A0AAV2TIK5_CALDB
MTWQPPQSCTLSRKAKSAKGNWAMKNAICFRSHTRTLSAQRYPRGVSGLIKPDMLEDKAMCTQEYHDKIVGELNQIFKGVRDLLNHYLTLNATADESKFFCKKMKGDHYSYLAKVDGPEDRDKVIADFLDAYEKAAEIAKSPHEAHPICPGLDMNKCVFYYGKVIQK